MPPSSSSRFTTVNDVRLHHLDHGGSGVPIVLIHGVLGHAHIWDATVDTLHDAGHVYALDLRGYGDSQWDPTSTYSTESHAADIAAWMDKQGLERAHIVGFSWGGLIGLRLATLHPELVDRLALLDISPSSPLAETDLPPVPLSFDTHAAAMASERFVNRFASPEVIDDMAAFSTRPGPEGKLVKKHDPIFAERWVFRSDDRWTELAQVTIPVLVVRAAENGRLSPEDAQRMLATASAASLVEIADSGHLIPLDNPDALAVALSAFVATEVMA